MSDKPQVVKSRRGQRTPEAIAEDGGGTALHRALIVLDLQRAAETFVAEFEPGSDARYRRLVELAREIEHAHITLDPA